MRGWAWWPSRAEQMESAWHVSLSVSCRRSELYVASLRSTPVHPCNAERTHAINQHAHSTGEQRDINSVCVRGRRTLTTGPTVVVETVETVETAALVQLLLAADVVHYVCCSKDCSTRGRGLIRTFLLAPCLDCLGQGPPCLHHHGR